MARIRFVFGALFAGILAIYGMIASASVSVQRSSELSREVFAAGQQGDYPPSFMGSEATYGFALFSCMAISALAMRYLILVAAPIFESKEPLTAPVNMARLILAALLSTVILTVMPDAVMLLAWGEVTIGSIALIGTIDRLCDGLSVIPFGLSIYLLIKGQHYLPEHLTRKPYRADLFPRIMAVKFQLGMIALILAMSAGVTAWK